MKEVHSLIMTSKAHITSRSYNHRFTNPLNMRSVIVTFIKKLWCWNKPGLYLNIFSSLQENKQIIFLWQRWCFQSGPLMTGHDSQVSSVVAEIWRSCEEVRGQTNSWSEVSLLSVSDIIIIFCWGCLMIFSTVEQNNNNFSSNLA